MAKISGIKWSFRVPNGRNAPLHITGRLNALIPHGLDQDKLAKLRPFLQPGEKILWAGAPNPNAIFSRSGGLQIPLEIAWIVFIIWFFGSLWTREAGDSRFPWFVAVPFFLITFYNLFGRLVFKYWRNRRTVYAVTDRNVAVLTNLPFSTRFRTLEMAGLAAVQQALKSNGRGSITFGDEPRKVGWLTNIRKSFSRKEKDAPVVFMDIANARRVHDLIVCQREELRQPR